MRRIVIAMLSILTLCAAAWADTLETVDGKLVQGKYLGGTQNTVRFQVKENVVVYQVKDVLAITFSSTLSSVDQPTLKPSKPVAEPVQKRPKAVTIASGTLLPVRMLDTVDVSTSKKDDWFQATLDTDLIIDGIVVAPKGTAVNGQVVKADSGRRESELGITLQELVIKEDIIPIITTTYTVQEKTRTIIDANALKVVSRSRALKIPEQAVVEFRTTEPVKIELAK